MWTFVVIEANICVKTLLEFFDRMVVHSIQLFLFRDEKNDSMTAL